MSNNNTRTPAPLAVESSGRWLGNDGRWSTFYVNMGTPPQSFHVIPSFRGQTLYVPIEDDCLRMNLSDCGGSRGVEIFESKPSPGFQVNKSSTWEELGIYQLAISSQLGLEGNGWFGYDTMGPSAGGSKDTPKLERQAVAAYASFDFWLGMLGLSMFPMNMSETEQPRSFLSALKEESIIPSLSFGYQAGAPYRFTKVAGSLTLGGYDRSRIANDTLLFPISEDLVVGIQGISVSANDTQTELINDGILAFIDTSVPEIWLPPSVCDSFASTLGLIYHNASDRYVLPSAVGTSLQSSNPTFTFTLGTSISGGETIAIELPYSALALVADYPIFAEPTDVFAIRRAANESQFTIGRALLQEVYLTVDWERETFNISQAHFSAPMPDEDIVAIEPKGELVETGPKPGGGKKALPAGAIAGIVVGVVVLLALVAGVVWWVLRRRRRSREKGNADGDPPPVFEEEKKGPGENDAPEVGEQGVRDNGGERTDAELLGRPIVLAELGAPHGSSEAFESAGGEGERQVGEMDAAEPVPVHELPAPVAELDSRDVRR